MDYDTQVKGPSPCFEAETGSMFEVRNVLTERTFCFSQVTVCKERLGQSVRLAFLPQGLSVMPSNTHLQVQCLTVSNHGNRVVKISL